MKAFVQVMAQALVDNMEAVEVTEVDAQQTVVYELKVDKTDLGKVIGREGRIAGAMRVLLSAHAAKLKTGKRVVLEILE